MTTRQTQIIRWEQKFFTQTQLLPGGIRNPYSPCSYIMQLLMTHKPINSKIFFKSWSSSLKQVPKFKCWCGCTRA